MPGRRPKPTAIHILNGNPSDLSRAELEAKSSWKPKVGFPEMPKTLPKNAQREWRRMCNILFHQRGVLTVADGKALAGYCSAWAMWEDAQECINRDGSYIRVMILDKRTGELVLGDLKVNPAVLVQLKALQGMRQFAIEFGMTPASRTKIHVGHDNEGTEPTMEERLAVMPSDPILTPEKP